MKKFFLFAAVALLAACSSDDLTDVQQNNPIAVADDGSVGFDAYVVRGLTRAGGTNDINLSQLNSYNFGVFGYYTDNNDYDGTTLPNFFYNQKVTWNDDVSGNWGYTPVKYWPNEYGDNAISDDNDRVTFFAYAPYVDFNASTGKIKTIENGNDQWGIVQASRNTNAGDPWVKYNVSFDGDKQVDLLWGVNKDYASWNTVNSGTQTLSAGLPWLNVQRPAGHGTQAAETQRVKFQFKHALAKLTTTIDAVVDNESALTNSLDAKTRIYVRSITFTGFTTKGMLNLNNTEKDLPLWLEYNGNGDLEPGVETTIHDGRKEGKEGTAGIASNEKVLGLNPQLVQDENQLVDATAPTTGKVWNTTAATAHVGVTNTPQNLFRKWDGAKYVAHETAPDAQGYIYVIPTGEEVQVTIVYDVETISENLPVYLADGKTSGSSIENKITKTVNFGEAGLEAGKAYTLKLHLGMNSVKIDAAVTDWDEYLPEQETHLPNNSPEYAAGGSYTFSIPGATTTAQTFTLTGFYGGESVLATAAPAVPITAASPDNSTSGSADATGKLTASVTCGTASTSTKDKSTSITWKGQSSNRTVTMTVVQLARPLGLGATGTSASTDITLTCTTGVTDAWTNVTTPTSDIKVIRNGVELTVVTGDPAAGNIKFDSANGKLILNGTEKVVSGDRFEITIKSGDAQAETYVLKIS